LNFLTGKNFRQYRRYTERKTYVTLCISFISYFPATIIARNVTLEINAEVHVGFLYALKLSDLRENYKALTCFRAVIKRV